MKLFFLSFFLFVLKILPIITVCLLSDLALNFDFSKHTPSRRTTSEFEVLKALCDNVGHGLTALLAWLVVINYDLSSDTWNVITTVVCGLCGSMIDLDHFYSARSIRLQVSCII